jgi:hypothetical protein
MHRAGRYNDDDPSGRRLYATALATLEKGDNVAILEWYPQPDRKRKTASGIILAPWLFVHHWVDQDQEYGWVPRKALDNCKKEDGTP